MFIGNFDGPKLKSSELTAVNTMNKLWYVIAKLNYTTMTMNEV